MPPDVSTEVGDASEPLVRVVAAVIREGERYLLCQRPLAKRHGGLWEFPGGKMHEGETVFEAVRRELLEELGVETIRVGDQLAAHRDADSPYVIEFYPAEIAGVVTCREHELLQWMTTTEVLAAPLAPSDRKFAARAIA